jgi:hypothetical protein
MAAASGIILLVAVLLFLFPALAINLWPWTLTPLTARVVAGWQALLGAGGLVIARQGRWSAWPIPLQSIGLWQLLLLLALLLYRAELGEQGVLNWFVGYTAAGIVAIALLLIVARRQGVADSR